MPFASSLVTPFRDGSSCLPLPWHQTPLAWCGHSFQIFHKDNRTSSFWNTTLKVIQAIISVFFYLPALLISKIGLQFSPKREATPPLLKTDLATPLSRPPSERLLPPAKQSHQLRAPEPVVSSLELRGGSSNSSFQAASILPAQRESVESHPADAASLTGSPLEAVSSSAEHGTTLPVDAFKDSLRLSSSDMTLDTDGNSSEAVQGSDKPLPTASLLLDPYTPLAESSTRTPCSPLMDRGLESPAPHTLSGKAISLLSRNINPNEAPSPDLEAFAASALPHLDSALPDIHDATAQAIHSRPLTSRHVRAASHPLLSTTDSLLSRSIHPRESNSSSLDDLSSNAPHHLDTSLTNTHGSATQPLYSNWRVQKVDDGGNCLFHSLEVHLHRIPIEHLQLQGFDSVPSHEQLRHLCINHLLTNIASNPLIQRHVEMAIETYNAARDQTLREELTSLEGMLDIDEFDEDSRRQTLEAIDATRVKIATNEGFIQSPAEYFTKASQDRFFAGFPELYAAACLFNINLHIIRQTAAGRSADYDLPFLSPLASLRTGASSAPFSQAIDLHLLHSHKHYDALLPPAEAT